MKLITISIMTLAVLLLSYPATAQDENGQGDRKIPTKDEIIKKYDENGDGRLDEAEREKARSELGKRRGRGGRGGEDGERKRPSKEEILKEFDENGDGTLDEAERTKARTEMEKRRKERGGEGAPGGEGERRRPTREEILEKYDENGDGTLDEAERAKARAGREKQRGERGGEGAGKGAGKGRPGGDGERRRPSREEIRKKFDENGDGTLDEAERAKARAALEKRRGERGGEGRRGGGGRGGRGGKGGGRGGERPSREQILEEFDLDGDGELNEGERKQMREKMRERHGKGRGHGGGGGGRGGGGGGGNR